MISIKMYKERWQILIGDEVWSFEYLVDMKHTLNILLEIKEKHGKLKKDEFDNERD